MLNRIILIGRLTRDPDLRYTPNGKAVTTFTLAVDRPFTNQQGEREADFIDCKVWGHQAETVANHKVKGDVVAVDGRLEHRSYDDTKTGTKKWRTEVNAENVRFLPSGKKDTGSDMGTEQDFDADDLPF